jgi:hypothetical protein
MNTYHTTGKRIGVSMLENGVYWSARDLHSYDGSPVNHNFILLVAKSPANFSKKQPLKERSGCYVNKFHTVGGLQEGKQLKAQINQKHDVDAVREFVNPAKYEDEWDLVFNPVVLPSGTSLNSFTKLLMNLTSNYIKKGKVLYGANDKSGSVWVNTLLKVAGVTAANRKNASKLWSTDTGEVKLIPEKHFQPNSRNIFSRGVDQTKFLETKHNKK